MPSNLLLFLPILGGYWFIHHCYLTRFRAQRQAGHRLLLEAALFGILLVPPARLIVVWMRSLRWGSSFHSEWHTLTGGTPYLGTVCLSLAIALIAPFVCNLLVAGFLRARDRLNERLEAEEDFVSEEPTESPAEDRSFNEKLANLQEELADLLELARWHYLDKALSKSGNHLLFLFHRAVKRLWEDQLPVMLTLSNRKVYVGWVMEAPSLLDDDYVPILPLLSGHRDDKTLAVVFDIEYPTHLYEGRQSDTLAEDFIIVIPVAQVVLASFFNESVSEEFFPLNQGQAQPSADTAKSSH